MPKTITMPIELGVDSYTFTPEALKACLEYLYLEAMDAGLELPAHFIGVAAEATADLIEEAQSNDV